MLCFEEVCLSFGSCLRVLFFAVCRRGLDFEFGRGELLFGVCWVVLGFGVCFEELFV